MDTLFALIAAYNKLPEGWGFPDTPVESLPAEPEQAGKLRQALFPFNGDEGRAQMARWYYGLVRSYPAVALGISDDYEAYDPGLAWKSPIEIGSSEVRLTVDPASGILEMLWRPSGGDLTGNVVVDGASLSLEINGETYPLSYTESDSGDYAIRWPEFLETRAAFTGLPTVSFPITFRPISYDVKTLAESVEGVVGNSGALSIDATEEWVYGTPEERLALTWAIMQNLRHV